MDNHIASNKEETFKQKDDVANGTDFDSRVEVISNDWPPMVLETIFRNLATTHLLKCRLVNRKWNETASYVMRQRADVEIVIPFQTRRLMQHSSRLMQHSSPLMQHHSRNVSKFMSFRDQIECLKKSQHFPFASFRLKVTDEADNMERFLSIWGQNILELRVEIYFPKEIAILRGLLGKLLNLRKLHIKFVHNWSEKQYARLFDDSNVFTLPKLNVLRVQDMIENDYGIVADILKVATNLKSFENVCESYDEGTLGITCIRVAELTMLQSVNKLHCLKRVNLSFDEELIGFLDKSPELVNLQFESIILSLNRMFTNYTSQDADFINKLFWASRNSLLELTISPLGSVHGVELPKFKKLRKLSLSHDFMDDRCMFPWDFDMAGKFPNTQELVVDILGKDDYFSTYQPSTVMPNVESLTIIGDCDCDEKLMKMTPNVKTLIFDGGEDELPNVNFEAIASHLTKLENLKWIFNAISLDDLHSSCELDAMITGFSAEFCKTMSVQLRDIDKLSKRKIASYETKRKYVSMSELTGLKLLDVQLTMCESSECSSKSDDSMAASDDDDDSCFMVSIDDDNCDVAGFPPSSIFYKTGLTKVSKLLAFDLMPNLKTNIEVRFK